MCKKNINQYTHGTTSMKRNFVGLQIKLSRTYNIKLQK